jgi:hypothetical protein
MLCTTLKGCRPYANSSVGRAFSFLEEDMPLRRRVVQRNKDDIELCVDEKSLPLSSFSMPTQISRQRPGVAFGGCSVSATSGVLPPKRK